MLHFRLHRERDLVEYIDNFVQPTTLVTRAREDLLDRLPKADSAVTNRNFRGNVQPAVFQVDEQLAPALGAFSNADLEADEFFLALGRRAEQHQHAVAMLFHAGLRAAPTMAGRALEAQMAIERQKPDRERFWGNANIAFAENDPIFRSGWFERLDEGLPQVFGHRDFAAASLALRCPIDEMDGVRDGALRIGDHRPADVADLFGS